MLTNLFSIFDPSSSLNFNLNWLSIFLFVFYFPIIFWIFSSRLNFIFKKICLTLTLDLKNNLTYFNLKTLLLFLSLFWFIFLNNILSLFPYIFASTSHLSISLSLALPSWITFMIFGWINLYNKMFYHLVPLGTPLILSSFMVLIETSSNLIRPITLSIRLSANMIAGHLLLSLLSNLSEKNFLFFFFSYPFILILTILELAVSFIQSYVFITLSSLYFNEI